MERRTQNRVVRLFREKLDYDYLGNWIDRAGNSNIETDLLERFLLEEQGYDPTLVARALHEIQRVAGDTSRRLYDRNHAVYDLLRYGVKVRSDVGEQVETVWLIDWEHPERNQFAIAEEVAVPGGPGAFAKRPDIVLYVNGIALGVLELKRSIVFVAEGIRQNLDSQKAEFIEGFFSTVQLVMAGNDTEGLRYGVIGTKEKYFLTWKEPSEVENPLDRALLQMCTKPRLLELIHDFISFDRGQKKICRPHQYFGVKLAQERVAVDRGGIIWHAQGSGKSLTMVWLTKWIREHIDDARVLIVTDRRELDEQIERVYLGVNEQIHRTTSGADLITRLDSTSPWLMCSLIHKFGGRDDDEAEPDVAGYVDELRKAVPAGFEAKGRIFVFVDECHRTQSGILHEAMKTILPNATLIGFTGTPLLRKDKQRSVEVFGTYIHQYLFREAVEDKVILDLLYEARDIDQRLTSPDKVDQWFEAKTDGLTEVAKAQLKRRWGTMQQVLSSRSRVDQIVADVMLDMETRDRLKSGAGNALLVCDDIAAACRYYEAFSRTDLKGKCAIVTSYRPTAASIKGEASGEGDTEALLKFDTYRRMLADWFRETAEEAATKTEEFESKVKEQFINEPGQMKLLIVVNRLLTGFDAPPATYLYLDKALQDHGLFQAVCRVNRLDTADKEYGYIVDYMDLFRSLSDSMRHYGVGYAGDALAGFDDEDVRGLLKDRLAVGRERLEEARESVKALCEPVDRPRDSAAFRRYFCGPDAESIKANESSRLTLYRSVASLVRAFANIANEMEAAGYSADEVEQIRREVDLYEKVRTEVKLASGDYIDLKMYEPAMRHLIDTYIQADPSTKISAFDNKTLIELMVEQGPEAIDALPDGLRNDEEAAAETIENNVRKLIIDETPINPKYYERMSELLDALIEQRRRDAITYREFLAEAARLAQQAIAGPEDEGYPESITTAGRKALYDNLGQDEELALRIDRALRFGAQDGWRTHPVKRRAVAIAVAQAITASEGRDVGVDDPEVAAIVSLADAHVDEF
ncbi:MAG: HsdR family type I site-specific deoxyribonuclease [Microbacterium sp.]|nr:HsdR family type I site-specific deoxyribonuclease [Microbacterium sp.]